MNAARPAWASIRVQRRTRTARWVPLMRDARRAASRKHAHAVARAEHLVRSLDDGEVLAGVEKHGHLDAHLLVGGALDVRADNAAQHRAGNRAYDLAAAAAHIAAGHHPDGRAARGADPALAAVQAHVANRFDHAEAHRLLAANLVRSVVVAALRIGARAKHQRACGDRPDVPCHSLLLLQSVSPKADRKAAAIVSRAGRWFWPPRCAILSDPNTEASCAHLRQV